MTILKKKIQQKKYKKITESKEEIDLDVVNKDKSLIPYIAKLNSLNKRKTILEDRGKNAYVKNFIQQQQEMKQKGSNVSYNTLGKLDQLKTIYSNPDGFEIKNNEITSRANKINLNDLSDTEILLQDNQTKLNLEGKSINYRNNFYNQFDSDNLEIEAKFDLNKQIDVESVKALESEINDLTDEFSGLEVLAREKFPTMNDYFNSINSTIKDIDNSISKQDNVLKGIRVGLSCLIRKG